MPAFTGIENAGPGLVRFTPGAVRRVTVESDANILPLVETGVRGGILVLRVRPGASIDPTRLIFRITAPGLSSVTIAGSGDVLHRGGADITAYDTGSGNLVRY